MPWILCRHVSLSELNLLPILKSCVWCLLCMVFAFCFPSGCHVHLWGAQPLGFVTRQPFRLYPWQSYVPPANGLLHMLVLSQGEPPATHFTVPSLSSNKVEHTALGAWQSDLIPLPFLHGGVGLFSQVVLHPRHSWFWIWWVLNLVILVWWLGIRLMTLLAPGSCSISLLNHTFFLVSWESCPL